MSVVRKMGWKPSLPDLRDHKYSAYLPVRSLAMLPPKVDLRPHCPPVYDQGELGSCTANALAGLAQFLLIRAGKPSFVPSRLFVYYNERVLEDSVSEDSGASLTDGIKVLNKIGAPHESLWWYNVKKFAVKPGKAVYADAAKHLLGEYLSVDNTRIEEIKTVLSAGYPVVFGFTVYDSFMSDATAKTGVVRMPGKKEKIQGGHAVALVGYDDSDHTFLVRNSWGIGWGDGGYCHMPYAYVTDRDLSDDFWTAHAIG